jgi:hypothetical protein
MAALAKRARKIISQLAPAAIYACLLAAFWEAVQHFQLSGTLGGHLASAFICFALLLVPLWFFAFASPRNRRSPGAHATARTPARWIRAQVASRPRRIALAALAAVPYLMFSIPRHQLQWPLALAMAAFPVVLAALVPGWTAEPRFSWRDAVVMLALAAVLELGLLSPAWPYRGLGSLPKIYLADVALYVYLVIRGIRGMGYSFAFSRRTLPIALRELLFFTPFGIGLGLALKFISYQPRLPSPANVVAAVLVTFLLTAVPEELFFRGILQNLLERRIGRRGALVLTAVLFGLSHFHKGAAFNWRYVLLATIAGIFYGRAWRAERKVLTSSITHTAVDVIWSLWFR